MSPDHLTPEARSRNMAAIRSRDTGPEMRLRRGLSLDPPMGPWWVVSA